MGRTAPQICLMAADPTTAMSTYGAREVTEQLCKQPSAGALKDRMFHNVLPVFAYLMGR
jgi:hypothetical protein